jgi:threonine/homoserine/homoserine lactone efflux protein
MKQIIIFDGLKFGIFMQLAIGPLAIMVLNTSTQLGYINGLILMAGIIIIDMLYMFLACMGVSGLLQKEKLQTILKILGSIILLTFGINNILSIFNISIFPKTDLQRYSYANLFLQGIILTASNPLTIIFLGGIFTSRIIEKNYSIKNVFIFASGCIMARISFLVALVLMGSIIHTFLPIQVLKILNVIVGIIIIYFGIKLIKKIFT